MAPAFQPAMGHKAHKDKHIATEPAPTINFNDNDSAVEVDDSNSEYTGSYDSSDGGVPLPHSGGAKLTPHPDEVFMESEVQTAVVQEFKTAATPKRVSLLKREHEHEPKSPGGGPKLFAPRIEQSVSQATIAKEENHVIPPPTPRPQFASTPSTRPSLFSSDFSGQPTEPFPAYVDQTPVRTSASRDNISAEDRAFLLNYVHQVGQSGSEIKMAAPTDQEKAIFDYGERAVVNMPKTNRGSTQFDAFAARARQRKDGNSIQSPAVGDQMTAARPNLSRNPTLDDIINSPNPMRVVDYQQATFTKVNVPQAGSPEKSGGTQQNVGVNVVSFFHQSPFSVATPQLTQHTRVATIPCSTPTRAVALACQAAESLAARPTISCPLARAPAPAPPSRPPSLLLAPITR